MNLAIIGAGKVGGALGTGWSRTGHHICFGVTDPLHTKHAAIATAAGRATITTPARAAAESPIVVLAVPWDAVPDALAACGDLTGKIIIDATNPLADTADGLVLAVGFTTSGGEEVARLVPGAAVFKTMNQVGFAVMADTSGYAAAPVMYVASDDEANKPLVLRLVGDLGFEPIDAGPLRMARLLEPYAMLWIDQVVNRGAASNNAFAMLRKGTLQ